MTTETVNARITSTMLGIEDHGIMTAMLFLEYGDGCRQGYGGWAFDEPDDRERIGVAFGAEWVRQVLKVVGVREWESLPKMYVRVVREGDRIIRIGHMLQDRWFDGQALATKMYEGRK